MVAIVTNNSAKSATNNSKKNVPNNSETYTRSKDNESPSPPRVALESNAGIEPNSNPPGPIVTFGKDASELASAPDIAIPMALAK